MNLIVGGGNIRKGKSADAGRIESGHFAVFNFVGQIFVVEVIRKLRGCHPVGRARVAIAFKRQLYKRKIAAIAQGLLVDLVNRDVVQIAIVAIAFGAEFHALLGKRA